MERGKALLNQLRVSFTAPPQSAIQPSVWYTGVGIEPVQFTEQLVLLQTALNYANSAGKVSEAQNAVVSAVSR